MPSGVHVPSPTTGKLVLKSTLEEHENQKYAKTDTASGTLEEKTYSFDTSAPTSANEQIPKTVPVYSVPCSQSAPTGYFEDGGATYFNYNNYWPNANVSFSDGNDGNYSYAANSFCEPFTGPYDGNYGVANNYGGTYDGNCLADHDYDGTYNGSYNVTCDANYGATYDGNNETTYDAINYEGAFDGYCAPDYEASYDGTYDGNSGKNYHGNYRQTYRGNYGRSSFGNYGGNYKFRNSRHGKERFNSRSSGGNDPSVSVQSSDAWNHNSIKIQENMESRKADQSIEINDQKSINKNTESEVTSEAKSKTKQDAPFSTTEVNEKYSAAMKVMTGVATVRNAVAKQNASAEGKTARSKIDGFEDSVSSVHKLLVNGNDSQPSPVTEYISFSYKTAVEKGMQKNIGSYKSTAANTGGMNESVPWYKNAVTNKNPDYPPLNNELKISEGSKNREMVATLSRLETSKMLRTVPKSTNGTMSIENPKRTNATASVDNPKSIRSISEKNIWSKNDKPDFQQYKNNDVLPYNPKSTKDQISIEKFSKPPRILSGPKSESGQMIPKDKCPPKNQYLPGKSMPTMYRLALGKSITTKYKQIPDIPKPTNGKLAPEDPKLANGQSFPSSGEDPLEEYSKLFIDVSDPDSTRPKNGNLSPDNLKFENGKTILDNVMHKNDQILTEEYPELTVCNGLLDFSKVKNGTMHQNQNRLKLVNCQRKPDVSATFTRGKQCIDHVIPKHGKKSPDFSSPQNDGMSLNKGNPIYKFPPEEYSNTEKCKTHKSLLTTNRSNPQANYQKADIGKNSPTYQNTTNQKNPATVEKNTTNGEKPAFNRYRNQKTMKNQYPGRTHKNGVNSQIPANSKQGLSDGTYASAAKRQASNYNKSDLNLTNGDSHTTEAAVCVERSPPALPASLPVAFNKIVARGRGTKTQNEDELPVPMVAAACGQAGYRNAVIKQKGTIPTDIRQNTLMNDKDVDIN